MISYILHEIPVLLCGPYPSQNSASSSVIPTLIYPRPGSRKGNNSTSNTDKNSVFELVKLLKGPDWETFREMLGNKTTEWKFTEIVFME